MPRPGIGPGRWWWLPGLLLGVLLAPRAPHAAPASPPPRERVSTACLDCHGGRDSTLAGSVHALRKGAADGADARIACTDCHTGDRRHWEDDPATYPMPHVATLPAAAEARLCATCHQTAHQQAMLERGPHAANAVNCSGCHAVHGNRHAALVQRPQPELCYSCHSATRAEFARASRHPVEGVVRCTDCHSSLDAARKPLARDGTNVCGRCHAQYEGPFPYEHPAAQDFSTDGGGCIACHDPHGSNLPRMLRLPYEGARAPLCTQCHSVPGHARNSMHGTQWAGKACNDCHSDIHGSYDNRLFLRPSMRDAGCSNAGCHHF